MQIYSNIYIYIYILQYASPSALGHKHPAPPLAASVADPPAPAFASGTAEGPSPGGAASPAPCGTSAEASPPTGGARRFGAAAPPAEWRCPSSRRQVARLPPRRHPGAEASAAGTLPVAAARGSPAARWHATPAAAAGHRGWAQLGGRRPALTQHLSWEVYQLHAKTAVDVSEMLDLGLEPIYLYVGHCLKCRKIKPFATLLVFSD